MAIIDNKKASEQKYCKDLQEIFFKYYTFNEFKYLDTEKSKNGSQYLEFSDAIVIINDNILVFQMKGDTLNEKSIKNFNYDECKQKGIEQLKYNQKLLSEKNLSDIIAYQGIKKSESKENPIDYKKNENTKIFYILCMDTVETIDEYEDIYDSKNDLFLFKNYDHFKTTLDYTGTIVDFVNYLDLLKNKPNGLDQMKDIENLYWFIRNNRSMEELNKYTLDTIIKADDGNGYIFSCGHNQLLSLTDDVIKTEATKILKEDEETKKILKEIRDIIYNDNSKSEQEKEYFLKYFCKESMDDLYAHTKAIIKQIKNNQESFMPSAYVGKEEFDGIFFRYIKPDYNKIGIKYGKTIDQAREMVKNNIDTFEKMINIINNASKAGITLPESEKIDKIVTINYTDKRFDYLSKP